MIFSVRRTLQRTTTVSFHLVRRITGLPSKKYGPTGSRNRSYRHYVSSIFRSLYSSATFRGRPDNEKTIYKIYMSFRLILFLPM